MRTRRGSAPSDRDLSPIRLYRVGGYHVHTTGISGPFAWRGCNPRHRDRRMRLLRRSSEDLRSGYHDHEGLVRSQPKNMNPLDSIDVPLPRASSKRLLPWLVAVAFFMESLDTTILNTAVPTIAEALKVAPLSMKSVLASYTLSLAVFIPISGWMADRFGTRRVFASAIGLFTLGSFLCGISSDLHVLVACRILQGCGGAMMVPVGRLTLVRTFAKSELIRASGIL